MSPLFSIVMPVLNAGAFLERALRSVLAQAGDDTEVIVVDGGSTDGSVAVIEALLRPRSGRNGECKNGRGAGGGARGACDGGLARGEPGDGGVFTQRLEDTVAQGFYPHLCDHWVVAKRSNGECKNGHEAGEGARGACDGGLARGEPGDGGVFTQRRGDAETQGFYPHLCDHWVVAKRGALWCSEPDGGQSAALNKGFARASGRYLLWINADDLLLPGTLDRARAHLRAHPGCAWLAGNLVYIDAQDRVLRCARDGRWHDWLFRHAPVRVYGPTSIFSRALFERVGGFDESLHYLMDTDLWLRFKAAGARFERMPHYCWAFRVHGGSKTAADLRGAADPRMLEERARVYAKNGLRVTRAGLWQQRAWRLLNGCYARAWWEGRRYCDPLLRPRSGRNGECKNGGGAGEGAHE